MEQKYWEATLWGAAKGVFGAVVEHPLDFLKTRSQASLNEKPTILKTSEIAQEALKRYQKFGIQGLYTGFVPNSTRVIVKHTYRLPMEVFLPTFFQKHLSKDFQVKYPDSALFATGLFMAIFETCVYSPFERCKVFMMTSQGGKSLREFMTLCVTQKSEVLRGIQAVFARQLFNWTSYLYVNRKAQEWERQRLQVKELPITSVMAVSAVTGAVNTLSLPLDVAKTSLQMRNPSSMGMWKILCKIYAEHGIAGVYAGWQPRSIQFGLQAGLTTAILNCFQAKV